MRAELKRPVTGGSTVSNGDAIVGRLLDIVQAGDVQAITLIFAYLEGQPIARTEQGEPGAFDNPLEDIPIAQLRTALMRIT